MATGGSTEQFRESLIAAGLLIPTGVDGLFGRSDAYEQVVSAVKATVQALPASQGYTRISFPPVIPRQVLEQTGYLESFPNLIGAVHSFYGSDAEHSRLLKAVFSGEDWSGHVSLTNLALCPSACHPLYPLCTGRLPADGRRFEVSGYCFRHEPSLDPARMQSFRMHEYVYVGDPGTAFEHREQWVEVARDLLASLGLHVRTEAANDPFFGSKGELLAHRQLEAAQKIEVVAAVPAASSSTAAASSNWHRDHFGELFGIKTDDGEVAHSACVGFGLDRIAVALYATHGLDQDQWPEAVNSTLWASHR